MAHVVVMPPFADEFLGGRRDVTLAAGTLFALVRALDRESPGFAEAVEMRGAIAVDGMVATDWSQPLRDEADVLVIPRVAGG